MSGDETYDYDLIVIGGGPAGEKGAAQAAYFGKRVALIEDDDVGGVAVNTGTLPSKTLRETALYLSGFRQRGLYGVDYTFDKKLTVDDLVRRERSVVDTHRRLVEENIGRHGIELLIGVAALRDAHTVEVAQASGPVRTLTGEVILIATGSRPHRAPGLPFDSGVMFDSDTILHLDRLPASLIVIGAGFVGCEYATLFGALGARVHLIEGGARLLPRLDHEAADLLAERMEAVNVRAMCGRRVAEVEPRDGGVCVTLSDGEALAADAALFCGGRQGNTDGLNLEALGVRTTERGRIEVDGGYRTSVANIYAAGDVLGSPALASTGMEQARVAVCHAFGFEYKKGVSGLVAYGLYTIPEVAMAGATSQELEAQGRPYLAGRGWYRDNARAQILGDTSGMIKLLFDPEDTRLLGVHIVGEQATELVHIGQACLSFEGTLDFFIQSVFNFPTLSDLYKYAAYDGLGALQRQRAGG